MKKVFIAGTARRRRVFITGGTGFIGQAVVKKLLAEGWTVIALARNLEKTQQLNDKHLKWVMGDIRESSWHKEVSGCQAFIYLSGIHGHIKMPFAKRLEVELGGIKNAVRLSKQAKISHFIYINTAYIELGTDYAKAKKVGKIWLESQIKNGFPATIVCPVTVYGPGDMANLYRLFQAVYSGKFFFIGNGQNPLPVIYIDDLVQGLMKILTHSKKVIGKTLILGSGENISWLEFIQKIAKSEGVGAPKIHLPYALIFLLGKIFSKVSQLGIPVPFTLDTVQSLTSNLTFDTLYPQKLLNFKPQVNIKNGIEKSVAWYQKAKLI